MLRLHPLRRFVSANGSTPFRSPSANKGVKKDILSEAHCWKIPTHAFRVASVPPWNEASSPNGQGGKKRRNSSSAKQKADLLFAACNFLWSAWTTWTAWTSWTRCWKMYIALLIPPLRNASTSSASRIRLSKRLDPFPFASGEQRGKERRFE